MPNVCDLCLDVFDPAQEDTDQDWIGDACDRCPLDSDNDPDSDGVCSGVDVCPLDANNDGDGDGVCAHEDNCPDIHNPLQKASDADLFGDDCDNCDGISDLDCVFTDGFESGDTSAWSGSQ